MTAALTLQIFGAFPVTNEAESGFLDCAENALSLPVTAARNHDVLRNWFPPTKGMRQKNKNTHTQSVHLNVQNLDISKDNSIVLNNMYLTVRMIIMILNLIDQINHTVLVKLNNKDIGHTTGRDYFGTLK